MMQPIKVIDNDINEVRIELDGQCIRSWEYHDRQTQRTKMLMAREFAEGWHQCLKQTGISVAKEMVDA